MFFAQNGPSAFALLPHAQNGLSAFALLPDFVGAFNNGVPISWYLILSAVLFALGAAGFVFRRNIITVFMCIELMLNAVNLSFIAFANQHKEISGHIFVFFVMVVAAAEAAVGLAIILTVFKNRETLNIDDVNSLKN